MTELLHQIIMILFDIITEGGNGLLVKTDVLDCTNKSRLLPNLQFIVPYIRFGHGLGCFNIYKYCAKLNKYSIL